MTFSEEDDYRRIAEAYALDAVDFARANFEQHLDWTDQSIQVLESILDRFNREIEQAKPSDQEIMGFAKMFGSYLGEVFRKNHGATWGVIDHDGDTFPGLRSSSGSLFWPWGRAARRMREGPDENVWHYYQVLVGRP